MIVPVDEKDVGKTCKFVLMMKIILETSAKLRSIRRRKTRSKGGSVWHSVGEDEFEVDQSHFVGPDCFLGSLKTS